MRETLIFRAQIERVVYEIELLITLLWISLREYEQENAREKDLLKKLEVLKVCL